MNKKSETGRNTVLVFIGLALVFILGAVFGHESATVAFSVAGGIILVGILIGGGIGLYTMGKNSKEK